MFIPSRGDFEKKEWFEIRNHEKNELKNQIKNELNEWKTNFKEEIQITKIRIKARFQ